MFKRRRFHTLQDIRKILTYIPPFFVLFIAILSIFLSSIIIENNQKNAIELLLQEEQFYKKKLLDRFINDSRDKASGLFDSVEKELNHRVYEVSGYIKSLANENKNLSFDKIKPFVKKLEKEKNIQFVFFNSNTFEIIYGKGIVAYLQTLTSSNATASTSDSFRVHILKNIQFLGNENLQYWLDKNKRNIRLSYFEEIKELGWYFGAFSNVDDMSVLLKKSIIKSLSKKSKGIDSYFWFYDYKDDLVYNYHNFGKVETYEDIMDMFNADKSKKVLKYYHDHRRNNMVINETVFNFPKYQYLVSIKDASIRMPNNVKEKIAKIKQKSLNKFTTVVISIMFIGIFLGLAIVTFSKYINLILEHYNRRLEVKNKLQVHWKERYELAIIASNDGLWDINFEKDVIYFSDKWLEMFGYKRGDITTFEQWLNLIHGNDRQKVKKEFDQHLEGKSENFVVEYRSKTKSNIYKWVLVRGKVFKDEKGNPQRMLMMSMDIEQRKQLTKELEDVELLVEYGRIVIFKWKNNKNLDVVHVSKSINSYGYTPDDLEASK
jgi:PAS domain S-box-containing protein